MAYVTEYAAFGPHTASGSRSARQFKRLFDITFVLLVLPFVLLVLLICFVVLKTQSPGPVFFKHQRIGRDGKVFSCLKLRTMVPDADVKLQELFQKCPRSRSEFEETRKLRDDPRIIKGIGEFLRASSLDELPQFFNVLAGQMSMVGPRPVTAEELALYGKRKGEYLRVRPGLTGFWQVSGRNTISFRKRVRMDAYYVRNMNFWTDLLIIAKTARMVLSGQGAY